MDYWLISTGPADARGIDGGFVKRQGNAPGHSQPVNAFVCAVDVGSAQTSLDKALALGGTLEVPLMPVTGVGLLCYVKDPNGNIFRMLQPDTIAPMCP